MRFYIVLITLSMFVWAASAGVSGVGHLKTSSAVVSATDDATTDASAPPAIPADIANGGAVLPAPAGPRTPAEEKADAVLSCMEACGSATGVSCQENCVATGYNVNLSSPPPVVSATVPAPLPANATATTASATGAGPTASTVAHGSGAAASVGLHMAGAMVAVGLASLFVSL